jgi:hypothetical protein
LFFAFSHFASENARQHCRTGACKREKTNADKKKQQQQNILLKQRMLS